VRAGGGSGPEILSRATAEFRPNALNAVIGPSGCGKTTLVKSILRLLPVAAGESWLGAEPLADPDDLAGRVGFAQQFTNAHPQLSVEETFRAALDLAVPDSAEKVRRLASVLEITGLGPHRDKRVSSLSGGQLRRLGLGIELTLDPVCMVCDEVTSGLDPNSEEQILGLLRRLVAERGKTFFCIIHNLDTMQLFDWITVVFQGNVIFQGELAQLLAYFCVPEALRLYDTLNSQPVTFWRERWELFLRENPGHYAWRAENQGLSLDASPENAAYFAPALANSDADDLDAPEAPAPAPAVAVAAAAPTAAPASLVPAAPVAIPRPPVPSAFSQFSTLLRRRFLLFFRDTGYLGLTLAITFGFPIIVVIFAITGLPDVPVVSNSSLPSSIDDFQRAMRIQIERAHLGALVSGLIMFQVILLTLMGANNGGREIAAERQLYEKERLAGLSPFAYVMSKLVFVTAIACFQGAWMAGFVKTVCHFPGPWGTQLLTLMAVCVSMSIVCLGFSAVMQTAEKASLLSIYLVGFQIPLSGVVLALPAALTWFCRPFINAYWGWTGFMKSMSDAEPAYYDAFVSTNLGMDIFAPGVAFAVLLAHVLVALGFILAGCQHRRAL
jgi:ABC-type multidrug transport system ATPase subunit